MSGTLGIRQTLHVGGIQGEIEDESNLEALFSQFGAVKKCYATEATKARRSLGR